MPTIMISIVPDGILVDKLDSGGDGPSCPEATRDPDVNDVNLMYATDTANYHDTSENNAFVLTEYCGNCAAYNQTDNVLDCIGDDSGELGLCQIFKFVCRAEYVCDEWAAGGPIRADVEGSERDIL